MASGKDSIGATLNLLHSWGIMSIIQMNYPVLESLSLLLIKDRLAWLIAVLGWNSMDMLEESLVRHLKITRNFG